MQRMKELTRQSYGGSLAASAAAAEAAEARRNSPPRQKKEGAEMTVKDALQKHYQEQKRQVLLNQVYASTRKLGEQMFCC